MYFLDHSLVKMVQMDSHDILILEICIVKLQHGVKTQLLVLIIR